MSTNSPVVVAPASAAPPPSAAAPAAPADLARRFEQVCEAIVRESPSLAAQLDAMVALREADGTLYVGAKPGRTLPALPNARLDEATRKVAKKLLGASWILRPAAEASREPLAPSTRSRALEQVRDLFGGETVTGGEGGES